MCVVDNDPQVVRLASQRLLTLHDSIVRAGYAYAAAEVAGYDEWKSHFQGFEHLRHPAAAVAATSDGDDEDEEEDSGDAGRSKAHVKKRKKHPGAKFFYGEAEHSGRRNSGASEEDSAYSEFEEDGGNEDLEESESVPPTPKNKKRKTQRVADDEESESPAPPATKATRAQRRKEVIEIMGDSQSDEESQQRPQSPKVRRASKRK